MQYIRYMKRSGVIVSLTPQAPNKVPLDWAVLQSFDTDILMEFDTVDHDTLTLNKMDRTEVANILAARDTAAADAQALNICQSYINKQ